MLSKVVGIPLVEVSARTGENIEEAFAEFATAILHIQQSSSTPTSTPTSTATPTPTPTFTAPPTEASSAKKDGDCTLQ